MGSRIGSMLGSSLGNLAQNTIGKIFGFGEYKEGLATEHGIESKEIAEGAAPEVNSLVAPLSTNELVPMMHCDEEGMIRVVRREFCRVVNIGSGGTSFTMAITPTGSPFPWLSAIAPSWQQWSMLGMAFEYVPTSGVATGNPDGNAALGVVVMAIRYNPLEPNAAWPTTSTPGLLNMQGAVSMSPAAHGCCYVECDPILQNQPVKFVETKEDQVTSSSDANFNAGTLIIRTEGAQPLTPFECGQLWVTYEILLMNPRTRDPLAAPSPLISIPVYYKLWERLQLLQAVRDRTDRQSVTDFAEAMKIKAVFNTLEFKKAFADATLKVRLTALDMEDEKKVQQLPPPEFPTELHRDTVFV